MQTPNPASLFRNNPDIFKAIYEGWATNDVTPQLAEWLKKNIFIPIYQEAGWNIDISSLAISSDPDTPLTMVPMLRGKGVPLVVQQNGNLYNVPPIVYGKPLQRLRSNPSTLSEQIPARQQSYTQNGIEHMLSNPYLNLPNISAKWRELSQEQQQRYVQEILIPKLY